MGDLHGARTRWRDSGQFKTYKVAEDECSGARARGRGGHAADARPRHLAVHGQLQGVEITGVVCARVGLSDYRRRPSVRGPRAEGTTGLLSEGLGGAARCASIRRERSSRCLVFARAEAE